MRVLVIDTALGLCTAGVFEADGDDFRALGVRSESMTRGHSERLAGMARDAVAEAGGGFQALDRIGVTVGPGSFTGLRVGLAFAQGLGAALGIPVVGVSTLAALARSKQDQTGATEIAAAIDARRGQLYIQTFDDGAPLSPPRALSVEEAVQSLVARHTYSWSLVGSGVPAIVEALLRLEMEMRSATEPLAPLTSDVLPRLIIDPSPTALAALTLAADPDANPPRPLYLRAPDATPPTRLPGQARAARP